jgi:hypothetical protein
MTSWTRLTYPLALALLFAAAPPTALAQNNPQEAERLNDEGKRLFSDKQYEEAYGKFREAATLSPEGRFFFNMCYALNFLERYEEAIDACEQVEAAGGDQALRDKTQRALVSLREKQAARQAQAGPGDPTEPDGDPGAGDPGTAPPSGPPAGPDPFITGEAAGPIDSYTWSVGGELGVLGNLMGENDLGEMPYASGGLGVRLFANFVLSEAQRFGVQGSLGFGFLGPTDENEFDEPLGMADIGGGVFWHLPIAQHIYATPLAGLHLGVQQPQELSQGFISFGARGELALSYVFGPAGEHAVSLTPAINVYFPAAGSIEGRAPEEYGFDKTRATFALNAGYSFRFSTPFGTTPLITLE